MNLFLGASAVHFQMYLMEGLVQWNEARGVAAVEGASRENICYGDQLQQYCNVLSQQLLGLKLAQDYTSPGEYTCTVFRQIFDLFLSCFTPICSSNICVIHCFSTGELIGV